MYGTNGRGLPEFTTILQSEGLFVHYQELFDVYGTSSGPNEVAETDAKTVTNKTPGNISDEIAC